MSAPYWVVRWDRYWLSGRAGWSTDRWRYALRFTTLEDARKLRDKFWPNSGRVYKRVPKPDYNRDKAEAEVVRLKGELAEAAEMYGALQTECAAWRKAEISVVQPLRVERNRLQEELAKVTKERDEAKLKECLMSEHWETPAALIDKAVRKEREFLLIKLNIPGTFLRDRIDRKAKPGEP